METKTTKHLEKRPRKDHPVEWLHLESDRTDSQRTEEGGALSVAYGPRRSNKGIITIDHNLLITLTGLLIYLLGSSVMPR